MNRRFSAPYLLPLLFFVAGCVARNAPPSGPGYEQGGIPDLRGARVLALPVQIVSGVHPDVGQEIDYALRARTGSEGWIFPDEVRDILRANPGTGLGIDALPVDVFLTRQVQRLGEPLFGHLYRLGGLVNATYALLPIEARSRIAEEGNETAEIVAALIEMRTGRVFWFGIVGGSVGPAGDLGSAATAAEALARRVVR